MRGREGWMWVRGEGRIDLGEEDGRMNVGEGEKRMAWVRGREGWMWVGEEEGRIKYVENILSSRPTCWKFYEERSPKTSEVASFKQGTVWVNE